MLNKKQRCLPFLMWLFPLLFFTYQFILRLWPGLMMNQMMSQFSIDATSFGVLAAFYYYGYSGMQIPVAILLERFGVRYIVPFFVLVCGLATVAFTYTDNFYVAVLSRFLVGAGSAVGFLGVSKVVSEWFPKEQYARMIGFSFTIGLMGAIYGGKPISLLIETYSWHNVALGLAAVAISISVGSYLTLRAPSSGKAVASEETSNLSGIKHVLKSPVIWLLAASNLLMVGALEGFADVWGVQYLVMAYDITKNDAAVLISLIFFGMLFGGPILATLSRYLGYYSVIGLAGVGMGMLFTMLLLNEWHSWWFLAVTFFVVGVLCCYQVIIFAAGAELVSKQNLGVTVAFLNSVNMLGGSFSIH